MHPHCIYVFDSSTANEAAIAVKEGQYNSIIQYHSNKHGPQPPHIQHPHQPHIQHPHQPHMMTRPPSYATAPPPPHHHASPNHMQPQSQHPLGAGIPPPPMVQQQPPPPPPMQQQPYDPNLSPQKMKERESKLVRLGQLAQLTTQPQPPNMAPVPPPTMHQMTNSQNSAQRTQQPPQSQAQQPPPPPTQQPPPHQQQQPHIKQEQQQHLDPLSSMAAMSECPNMDSYGHTVHHHPPN